MSKHPMSTPLSERRTDMATRAANRDKKRITDLEKRQADLERRIAELESAAARQVPWGWPPTPQIPDQPWPFPNMEEARCPVCLMKYRDLTHYVCNHPMCPSRISYTCDTNADASTPQHLRGSTSAHHSQ